MIATTARQLLRRLSTPVDPDAFLTLFDPTWSSKLRGVVEQVTPLTEGAAAITIRPGASWGGHRPGQFVTVGVDVDGVRHHRCYSLTSPPQLRDHRGVTLIQIAVQATDGGLVSSHLVHGTRVGDVVTLGQADGDFTLDCIADGQPLLFVTGGSGITPVMGMLRWMDRVQPGNAVTLLHHATDPERCLFLDELEQLAEANNWLRVHTSFTRVGSVERSSVRLSAERLDELCPDWRSRQTYVCGPEPLLDFVTQHWQRDGSADRLHTERFVPSTLVRSVSRGDSPTTIARFAASDLDVLTDDSTPLLDIAETAGLTPPSGCRMGICHTCSTRLERGCVRDLRDGRLKEAGQHVQICVSAAVDDVVLDL